MERHYATVRFKKYVGLTDKTYTYETWISDLESGDECLVQDRNGGYTVTVFDGYVAAPPFPCKLLVQKINEDEIEEDINNYKGVKE